MSDETSGEIILYKHDDGSPALDVRLDGETVWLTQAQIVKLFQSSKANISEHISNIFAEGEVDPVATVRESRTVQQEGSRRVSRSLTYYNLDLILSVGYRVKSKIATQFRIWATERLREHLVQGYTLNEQRLEQLGAVVQILARSDDELIAGIADVIADYLPGLTLLRDYDEGALAVQPVTAPSWELTIDEARHVITRLAQEFPADTMLGRERGNALEGIISSVYQGFEGQDLYPTVEEKAANLLYLVIKDHPLADGNKRSGAALFAMFLAGNGFLHDATGQPRFTNNALAALTLLIAMSDPAEKALLVDLVVRMIGDATK